MLPVAKVPSDNSHCLICLICPLSLSNPCLAFPFEIVSYFLEGAASYKPTAHILKYHRIAVLQRIADYFMVENKRQRLGLPLLHIKV